MFDANKGTQVSQARIEAMSDQLATDAVNYLENPSVSRSEKEAAIKAATAIFADPEALKSLATGTFAQNSTGQPALQLGASSTNKPSPQEVAQLIGSVASNQDQAQVAMRFLLPSSDASFLEARGGVPLQVSVLERELENAKRELDQAKDPNVVGSLAEKAKSAEAARSAAEKAKNDALKNLPNGTVLKKDVLDYVKKLRENSKLIGGKAETDKLLEGLEKLVS